MKKTILAGVVACSALSGYASSASANCKQGTPFVNSVILDAVTNEQAFHDQWFEEVFRVGPDGGWTLSRGFGDPMNSDLEYNKVFAAALIVASAIDSEELSISQDPVSGEFRYTPDQIYLNPAFHRSRDEWAGLAVDNQYAVCDALNPTTGEFECTNRGWGGTTTTAIADVLPPEWSDLAPYDTPAYSLNGRNTYFCPAFEDEDGEVTDESFLTLGIGMIQFSWRYLRGNTNLRKFIPEPDGAAHEGLGRETIDQGLGWGQVQQRYVCDLMDAHADWVPQVLVEVAAAGGQKYLDTAYYDGLPNGLMPFSCGPYDDAIVVPDGIELCDSGNVACQADSDCAVGKEECSAGCCVGFVK